MTPITHLLSVRVTAGARAERIIKKEKRWDISVREPAEENRANHRVRELIARELALPLPAVQITKGHHSPSKIVTIKTLA